MFALITRNNRLFMLGNFMFALSCGLWMNLRQIHLLDLGATPAQIGSVFALVAMAGGLLPLPAGVLADRLGPKRVILAAWLVAAAGALLAALAPSWPVAGAGYIIFMLCIAANPATVTFVLLNARDQGQPGSAEGVMATVFASWPAAMIFAPALGGLLADRFGLQANLWLGAAGLLAAAGILALASDTQPARAAARPHPLLLVRNRRYVTLAVYFWLTLVAAYLGYALAPTFLQDARGFSAGAIGLLFSVASVGTLLFRGIVVAFRPRASFAILVGLAGLGIALLWQTRGPLWAAAAFLLLGAFTTNWVVTSAAIGRAVPEHQRGLALGVIESLNYGGIALASWLAGRLYEATPAHDLPLAIGSVAILAALVGWLILPLEREPPPAGPAFQPETAPDYQPVIPDYNPVTAPRERR